MRSFSWHACARVGAGVIHTDLQAIKQRDGVPQDLFGKPVRNRVASLPSEICGKNGAGEKSPLLRHCTTIDEKSRKIPYGSVTQVGRAVSLRMWVRFWMMWNAGHSFQGRDRAQAAKEELQFFIEHLKIPQICSHGPESAKECCFTVLRYGKNHARQAMAGESNVAFIAASASNL